MSVTYSEPTYCQSCHTRGMGEYVRRMFSDGSGYHVMLRCVECRCNARGPSQWIAKSEMQARGIDPDLLPAHESASVPAGQGVLL